MPQEWLDADAAKEADERRSQVGGGSCWPMVLTCFDLLQFLSLFWTKRFDEYYHKRSDQEWIDYDKEFLPCLPCFLKEVRDANRFGTYKSETMDLTRKLKRKKHTNRTFDTMTN